MKDFIERIRQRLESDEKWKIQDASHAFDRASRQDLHDKPETFQDNVNKNRPMRLGDLPKELLQRFVGENHIFLILVSPSQDIWEPDILGRFVHDVRSVDPDAIGDPATLHTFTKEFRNACISAVFYAFFCCLQSSTCFPFSPKDGCQEPCTSPPRRKRQSASCSKKRKHNMAGARS